MKMRLLLLLLYLFPLTGSICLTGCHENTAAPAGEKIPESGQITSGPELTISAKDEASHGEMRGIWIPFMSLTLTPEECSADDFRRKAAVMAQKCADLGLNTMVVHVRPFGDAIYPSAYFPWSHILTGTQGKDPGFDPLSILLEEAHRRGLAVHAWINPFRISTGQTPSKLSADNPYCQWQQEDNGGEEQDTFSSQGGIYYNPSSVRVRRLILDGIRELVQQYDIDGIQIDDYFYPEEDMNCDKKSYQAYVRSVKEGCLPLSQKEWRRENINMLLCGIYRILHSGEKDIVFGISPQCNMENNEKMCADFTAWAQEKGYADYLCPQMYISNDHPVLPFEEAADEWKTLVTADGVRLYGGLGLYKAGTDADSGTWLGEDDIIRSQIELLRQKGADGFMLYSYEYLNTDSTEKEVEQIAACLAESSK